MNKNRKKIYDPIRAQAIKWTAARFGVTEGYVRQIDNNSNIVGGNAEEIRKSLRMKQAELKEVLS